MWAGLYHDVETRSFRAFPFDCHMRVAGATRSSDALCTLCPAGTFLNATGEKSQAKGDIKDRRGCVKWMGAAGHSGDGRDCTDAAVSFA